LIPRLEDSVWRLELVPLLVLVLVVLALHWEVALLRALLALEQESGRTREFQNAPRTLDLDVLLYDDLQHHQHGLTLPHPQMHRRAFVLLPLLEIAPDCVIPGVGAAAQALQQCNDQQLERLAVALVDKGSAGQ